MKKTLLQWNLVFLTVQTALSFWWLGFQYGRCYAGLFDGVSFLAVPLILLGIYIGLFVNREYVKVKIFGIAGTLALAWAVFLLVFCFNHGSLHFLLEDYVYMMAAGALSLLSAVFCFCCAWITRQESRRKP